METRIRVSAITRAVLTVVHVNHVSSASMLTVAIAKETSRRIAATLLIFAVECG